MSSRKNPRVSRSKRHHFKAETASRAIAMLRSACAIEPLESRTLLAATVPNVFATFQGKVEARGAATIPIEITPANFSLAGRKLTLGFHLAADNNSTVSGGALDPAVVQVKDIGGNAIRPQFLASNLSDSTDSTAMFDLPFGKYALTVTGERASSGAFRLDVYLVGDADGNRAVDAADRAIIHGMLGNRGYAPAADADLDGRVTGSDLAAEITNEGARARVTPLTISIGVSGAAKLPDGRLVTNTATSDVIGITAAGAAVLLDVDGDGFDDGGVTAAADGAYRIHTTLPSVTNTLRVLASGGFGQQATASVNVVLDTQPPVLELVAPHSGQVANQNIHVSGRVSDTPAGPAVLRASLDGGAAFDVTFNGTGDFDFMTTLALNGSADGPHRLQLFAADRAGNFTTVESAVFTLDTQLLTPTFELSAASDSGALGDHATTAGIVTVVGRTDMGETVTLSRAGATIATALASSTGVFQFAGVPLALGDNLLRTRVEDAAGNVRTFDLNLTRLTPDPDRQDVSLRWERATLDAIRLDASAPPMASRALGMVSTAVFDAVSAIEGTPGFLVKLMPPTGSSAEAAAAAAAHNVLSYLYPAQQATFDAVLTASLAQVPDGASENAGVGFGNSVGDAVVALRTNDGARDFLDYVPPDRDPGTWQPTTPMFAEALLPQFATVQPFAMSSPSQFRPPAPPTLGSAAYAAALNEVQAKGRATGSTRTGDETQSALFWADGVGTVTPAGHWNQIAMHLAEAGGNSLSANARLFATLNVALADAGITAWNTKYEYALWRPVTAIQQAGADGNAQTTPDTGWTPLLITPNFPSYISGHSTYSGAAQVVLESFFGSGVGFTASTEAPGVGSRTFTSFRQAAEEAGQSRIFGGIHFQFDNQAGLSTGRSLGSYVLQAFSLAGDSRAPSVSIQGPAEGLVTTKNVTVGGQVLDNLSGVKSLEVQIDGGSFTPVALSGMGAFSVPTAFALDGSADGAHKLQFRAIDFAGNVSTSTAYTFTLDTTAPALNLTEPDAGAILTSGSRLTGTAFGTGSAVTALSYAFDGGTAFSLVFDATTGGFDDVLNLSHVGAGRHTLSVTARDGAGNTFTTSRDVSLGAAIPLTITDVTPAAGSTDVGSTQRPIVRFSRPIVRSSLTGDDFYAIDSAGAKLPASVVLSDDNTAAWLFFASPLPGASTVNVTVDGSGIRGADGSLLDAAGNGTPGSKLTFSFSTVSRASLPGTSLAGIVADPGADLKPNTIDDVRRGPDGVLMTGDDVYLNPIAHVRVYILGQEDQAVFTDAQGRFNLASVPSGNVKLVLDGMTASNTPAGCYFPEMTMDLTIEPGKVNTVMGSMGSRDQMEASEKIQGVFLPRLKSAILQPVSDSAPTMITVSPDAAPDLTAEQRALLTAEVQPGTAIGADGTVMSNVQMGISTVPPELIREMLPPGVSEPPFTITVQAPGVVAFSTPVALSYPNVDNLAPGTKTLFISFDHATGRLVIDGTATVSADGRSIVTDPDSGITHPGWHFVQVGTPTAGQPCKAGNVCVLAKGGRGDVIEVDLSGTGGTDFSQVSLSGGQMVYLQPADIGKGHFYFVPNVNGSDSYVQGTFSGTLTRVNEKGVTETKTETGIVRVNIKAGYSAFALSNSVGVGGTNNKLDVYRVQQRLQFLHFPGENNVAVPVNGQDDTVLHQAIKLFQAATREDGSGNPANEDGRVDPGQRTSGWLNAANAPIWMEIPQASRSPVIGNEIWASNWTINIIAAAGLGATVTSLTEYPDVAPTIHAEHKAGNDIDWDFDESQVPNNPPFPSATPLTQMLAQLSASERDLVDRIQAAHTAAGLQFVEVLIGGSGTEPTYPRVRQVLTALGISNRNVSGHDNHFHVSIEPPAQGPSAILASPDPSFVAQAGRIYYNIALSNGFALSGQIDNSAPVNVVLTPNLAYTATFYQPASDAWGIYSGQTNASGQITNLGTIILDQSGGFDTDGDGLPDVGELAIGTSSTSIDTDGDGVSDLAEIAQGLDPLSGRAFPTGVIATLPLQGNPEKIAVEGDRIYVATGTYGLAVLDGARFNGPIVLGQLDLPGTATDVGVDGKLGIAAVATGSTLQLVDVSRAQPRPIRGVGIPATRVLVANGLAYAASGNQLSVVDLANGSVVQSLTLPGAGTLTGFAREGTFLYAYLSGSDTFSVIDIAKEEAAVVRGQLFVSIASFDVGLFVGNGIAWLAGSGLRTIDVSNPVSPRIIQTPSGSQFFTARRIALNGSGLGLLLPDGGNFLQVYGTSNPNDVANLLLQVNLSGNARDIAISRGIAYVATGNGLEVVNYLPFDNLGVPPAVSISTSAADVDLIQPGLQIVEGSSFPIRLNVSDDRQVRDVELLVNGRVSRNDVSFPFDFFAIAPPVAPGVTSFTLQARATDTGGNVALSDVLTIGLVIDTTPPTITAFVPADASQPEPVRTVQVRFSKSMSVEAVNPETVRVRDRAGEFQTPGTFQLRDDGQLAQLTFPVLLAGDYEIVVSGAVTDRAGNALGADSVSPFTVIPRTTITTTTEDADPDRPGIQIFEGQTVEVLVQNEGPVEMIELFLNGVPVELSPALFGLVIGTDTSATVIIPNNAPGRNQAIFEARATDADGITTFATLTLDVLEDIVAPAVLEVSPADGSSTFAGVTTLVARFSEPIDLETATAANFRLIGPDGSPREPLSIQLREDDKLVQLTFAPLASGVYQLILDADAVTDRAGNPLGAGLVTATQFTLTPVVAGGLLGSFYRLPFGGSTSVIGSSVLGTLTPSVTTVTPGIAYFSDNPFQKLGFSLGDTNIAAKFTGWIRIDQQATFNFSTYSDDGSVLFIDDQLVVNNNNFQRAVERTGTIALTAGYHRIRVEWYQGVGEAVVEARYWPVGGEKQLIPSSVLYSGDSIDALTPGGLKGEFYRTGPILTTSIIGTLPSGLDALTPAVTAIVSAIDFNNYDLFDSIGVNVGDRQIAAQWAGYINITAGGPVTFSTVSDDGSVLFIDGALIVNNNTFQNMTERSATISLTPGFHQIRLEWFQGDGPSGIRLFYDPVDGEKQVIPSSVLYSGDPANGLVPGGLLGKFFRLNLFPATTLIGTIPSGLDSLLPEVTKLTPQIDFERSVFESEGVNIGMVNLAAVWSGLIRIDTTGLTRFFTRSDDGSLLYIDDVLVVNNNFIQGMTERSGDIFLDAGFHTIRVEWFQGTGPGGIEVWYDPADGDKQLIPANVLYHQA